MNPANWLYLLGSLCFLIGTVWNMATAGRYEDEDEPEQSEPFGFQVKDGGTVDGGEVDYESWE